VWLYAEKSGIGLVKRALGKTNKLWNLKYLLSGRLYNNGWGLG